MDNADGQSTGSPLCPVRPWPIPDADRSPKAISDYISLVNQTYPGGFRALNVAKITEGTNDESDDTNMADAEQEGAGNGDGPSAEKDPVDARNESLQSLATAHYSALFALDLVSLLLTKENPVQAGNTLRQDLRELVGIGTLASQKHAESNVTADKIKDLGDVTAGWHILSVEETRDSAKKAAEVLQTEVEKEAKYWEDVLTVVESGWSVCRLPQERQTLGVKFGFNEASPEFRKHSLAPMRRATDGSVELDLGSLGGQAQRLVITVERDGKITGSKSQTAQGLTGGEGSLPDRVLEARNTIYARELWHELQMEARNLQSYDVRQHESSITYTRPTGLKVRIQLLSADECAPVDQGLPDNWLAESLHITLHILLGFSHRQYETTRSRPLPPNQSRGRLQNQIHLLRPVIAWHVYMEAVEQCTGYIGGLVKSLRSGKMSDAKFELNTTQNILTDPTAVSGAGRTRLNPTHAVLNGNVLHLSFRIDLTITPGNRLTIMGCTLLARAAATVYQISLPNLAGSEHPNTLIESCPPHRDYPNLSEVRCYVDQAVSCALVNYFRPQLEDAEKEGLVRQNGSLDSIASIDGYDAEDKALWAKGVAGTSLYTAVSSPRELAFAVAGPLHNPHLEVTTMVRKEDAKVVKYIWSAEGPQAEAKSLGISDVCLGLAHDVYS